MLCGECGKVWGRVGGEGKCVESVGRSGRGEEKCGEGVSICEERCGSVEKCYVGSVGKRGKTKKGLHGRRRSFFCTKSR